MLSCCRWTKIKNLKANHNPFTTSILTLHVVAIGQAITANDIEKSNLRTLLEQLKP